MKLLITEILEKIEKAPTKQEKINIFKLHETPCLRGLMRINFDWTVSMGLPSGIPPYRKIDDKPVGYDHSHLETEYRKFYIWLATNNLTRSKKEVLFIQMLEALHHTEADLLCLIKDQELSHRFPSITEDLIRDIWPQILPPKRESLVKQEVMPVDGDLKSEQLEDIVAGIDCQFIEGEQPQVEEVKQKRKYTKKQVQVEEVKPKRKYTKKTV